MTGVYDAVVVGAGPAGRALAHRASAAGLRVAVVDPAPERVWSATYGMCTRDIPRWLPDEVVAASAPSLTAFTPSEHTVPIGYSVLDARALQRALSLAGVHVVAAHADTVGRTRVTCDDGTVLAAGTVVDARGAHPRDHPDHPRQTAAGAIEESDTGTMVLMDWRRPPGVPADVTPSFSYRVGLGGGRCLVEETCLAGAPPMSIDRLAARNRARTGVDRVDEAVDFPLRTDARPWRRPHGAPLRFGAGGGLMNPATGYSVAQSLGAVDLVVDALGAGLDPHTALWTPRARSAYRLRSIGLNVLLDLDFENLVAFFDAFFRIDPALQYRYLAGRDDAAGVMRAMAAVFARLDGRLRRRVARSAVRAWSGTNTPRRSAAGRR